MQPSHEIVVVLSKEECKCLASMLGLQGIECRVERRIAAGTSLRFDLETLNSLIIGIGSTGATAALAKIVATYLRERKKKLVVKRGPRQFEIHTET